MDDDDTLSRQRRQYIVLRRFFWGFVIAISVTTSSIALYMYLTTKAETGKRSMVSNKFTLHESPHKVPEINFTSADGGLLTLEHFKGKTILLNIWATWCPPCVEEMPTLDRLQEALGGDGFEVVALSIDRDGLVAVKRFYNQIGVTNLQIYVDDSAKAATLLDTVGLPSTLLINEQGLEIGRYIGPAEWDSLEMVSFLRRYIAAL